MYIVFIGECFLCKSYCITLRSKIILRPSTTVKTEIRGGSDFNLARFGGLPLNHQNEI